MFCFKMGSAGVFESVVVCMVWCIVYDVKCLGVVLSPFLTEPRLGIEVSVGRVTVQSVNVCSSNSLDPRAETNNPVVLYSNKSPAFHQPIWPPSFRLAHLVLFEKETSQGPVLNLDRPSQSTAGGECVMARHPWACASACPCRGRSPPAPVGSKTRR